ncbi:3-hydroxyacyl-CoA dehydrogenase NAD-binding domain-containing protein [uncultured Agitococcus sp.]|uniref:3-hydroxyacyl-CoA dehydrogenase NAD-binding domain-containing protein n=1 Tax=uncultured Agitococcus sp. TaxID=1506599 RepID=UPI0026287FC0|nr:3-hydroxyacyl-CoA dehydrogenase NAD-binding domain-containing protein [uncultured Agitococcus sp.]
MIGMHWAEDADGIVTLTMDDPTSEANIMNEVFEKSLTETVAKLQAEKARIKGIIVTSAKKTFFAGGDLTALIQAKPEHAPIFEQKVTELKALLRALETLGKPVVAAMNGTALGGGLEIALSCHHRIALNNPKAEFGLPEVSLGLLPGAGGVIRTVRMLGIQNALMNVLLKGDRMKVAKAKSVGLIDDIAESSEEMFAKAKAWILANPSAQQPWDKQGYKIPGGSPSTPSFAMNLPAFPANLKKQIKGANYPAPKAILCTAIEGAQVDFDNALKIEGRYFTSLACGKESKNFIKAFFFDLQKINKGASRPSKETYPVWKSKKVGVLGAGMMGQGIAYVSAMSGIEVVLLDMSLEAAERGKGYTQKLLDKRVSKGRMTKEAAAEKLALIKATNDFADLAGCDLVIEAVFESREIKADVTKKVEAVCDAELVFASNTSTLPITGLATASVRPQNFIGLHFFSPVDKMPLVEIICGEKTNDETLAKAFDYVLQIKKTPIVVNDSRGFFTSRVFGTFCMEGVNMLAEGFNPLSIEQAAAQAGMPVGPLAILDEVNMELTRKIRKQTQVDLAAEGKEIPMEPAFGLIDKMCDDFKRPGKKDGAGFYEYPADGKKRIWSGLSAFVTDDKKQPSVAQFTELKERLLYRQSIEAARCYQEGVLRSVADANIGSIFGIGMAPWTGGQLQYINYIGVAEFVKRADELAAKFGERFAPPQLLRDMAAKGETFQ